MISGFVVLSLAAILSMAFHRNRLLKPLALVAVFVSGVYTLNGASVFLEGFSLEGHFRLFELILEIVLFALILQEDEDITITQMLFIGAASMLLLQSDTLLTFVISFEAVSIISIILVSHIKTKEQAQGAVKMFMAAVIGTAILFLGLLFYVMGGGKLLAPITTNTTIFEKIGLFLMVSGIFYKLTIVPFHGWAVDAYALVRHSHAAILSALAKTVVALGTFKLFAPFLSAEISFSLPLLATLSVVTMTLGNFLALFEKKVAKILAYSSIAHAGYMLLAFVAVQSTYAKEGVLYMAIAYIFMQSGAFLALDSMRKKYEIQTLEQLKGFASQNPMLSMLFTIQLFSLAGIPLLGGFLAKAVVFYAGVDAGVWYIVLIALLNSALSVGYYAWIVKTIYFDKNEQKKREVATPLPLMAQLILAGGTLYFGIFAGVVFNGI